MISLLFFTRSSVAERDYSGRAGRNLAVRGETRGHKLRGKWPPTGSMPRPPSELVSAGGVHRRRLRSWRCREWSCGRGCAGLVPGYFRASHAMMALAIAAMAAAALQMTSVLCQ